MENAYSKNDYKAPKANVIEVNPQGVLCQSGNKSMREYDYGDGGFSQE